jgi:hypothetical protein
MPEPQPGEPPSRWTIINDYSKTVVTVCAALLAFIGAFSSKLGVVQLTTFALWDLNITVALLCLAALCALAVPGMLDRYLCVTAKGIQAPPAPNKNLDTATQDEWDSRKKRIWNIKLAANFSYIFLALAVIGMAVFSTCKPFREASDDGTTHQKSDSGGSGTLSPASPHYEVTYSANHRTSHGRETHTFLLNQATGEIWQMVCSADGKVEFRQLRRLDTAGKEQAAISNAMAPPSSP